MKKMISRRNFLAAAGVVAAAGVLTACGGSSNSTAASASTAASGAAASGDTIKVGVLGPLTGDVSVYGQAVVNGATLYLKQVNEKGGINGKQLEIIAMDEQGDATQAVTCFTKMCDQGITALVGDVTTTPTLALAAESADYNMPMVTASATAEAVTYDAETDTVNENVFRATFTDPFHSKSSKNKNDKYDTKASRKMPEPEIDDYEDDYYESVPRFRAVRIILGIISLAGFGFFTYKGFMTGLNGTTDGGGTSGTLYIILALCMLVSSLLYFIMQKSNTIFAFLLPMLFYLGSGVFAFLKRGDDLQLLIAAIVSGVLAIISLILAITSRGGSDYDDSEENYDEAFEDDYAEEEFDD